MKRQIILAGAALACLSLSACNTLGLTAQDSVGKQILQNLDGCTRHYQGGVGAGVTLSFDISCMPAVKAAASDLSSVRTAEPASPPGGT